MNEISTFTLIVIGAFCVILIGVFIILRILEAGYVYKVRYESLRVFKYYVENARIDSISHGIIIDRIKTERARREMNEPEYCNLVHEITSIFVKRFADFIREQGK